MPHIAFDSQIDTTAAEQTDTNYKLDIWLLGHWRQLLGHFTLQQLATSKISLNIIMITIEQALIVNRKIHVKIVNIKKY